jgi:hypothetical protein
VRIPTRTQCDLSYGSYLFLAAMALLTSYTGLWLPEHPDRAAALGFGVLIPFGVPMLIALVLGPGLSIFLLREWFSSVVHAHLSRTSSPLLLALVFPAPPTLPRGLLSLMWAGPSRLPNRSSCQAARRVTGRDLLAAPPSAALRSPGSIILGVAGRRCRRPAGELNR